MLRSTEWAAMTDDRRAFCRTHLTLTCGSHCDHLWSVAGLELAATKRVMEANMLLHTAAQDEKEEHAHAHAPPPSVATPVSKGQGGCQQQTPPQQQTQTQTQTQTDPDADADAAAHTHAHAHAAPWRFSTPPLL